MEVDERITYCFDIPEERRLDLLEMSPLEWQVSQEVKAKLQQRPLEKITIDVRLLVGRKDRLFVKKILKSLAIK